MSERIDVSVGQRRLAIIWLAAGAVLVLLLVAQSIGGKFGSEAGKAWTWLLPLIIPTLSLILGAVAYQATRKPTPATVDRFAYRVSLWLSAFYLLLVLGTVVAPALISYPSGSDMLATMQMSNLWLAPVQGLVGIALGVFFVSREAGAGPSTASA